MKPKPRQRKRPGAEPLGSDFGKNIAHLRRLRPAPVAKAIADDLVREQEGLRVQLATETANVIRVGEECLIRRRMLDVLSHALERANEVIKWLPDFRQLEGWEIVAVQHSFEAERLLKGTAKLQADLAAANSRIAELTAQFEHMRDGRDNLQVERDGMLARTARLTAEKSALDADCAKIRGERDKVLHVMDRLEEIVADDFCEELDCEIAFRPETFSLRERRMQDKLSLLYRLAHSHNPRHECYRVHDDWRALLDKVGTKLRDAMAPEQRPNGGAGACKPKPWYRRSFTELLARRGGAQ